MLGHHVTHGDVTQGQVPILFVPSEANLLKSLFACLNHLFYKAISLGMIPWSPAMVNESMIKQVLEFSFEFWSLINKALSTSPKPT